MKKYCVIGWPVHHSRSPALHNRWFRERKIAARYTAEAVSPRALAAFMRKFRGKFAGANVTIPHKTRIIKFCDVVSPEARKIGAVNTIVNRRGKLYGYNTDVPGALAALDSFGKMNGVNAIVLGAGGAARAVVYALRQRKCHVTILNRTLLHAKKLAQEFDCDFGALEDFPEFAPECEVLINTTSVGMSDPTSTPLPQLKELQLARKAALQKPRLSPGRKNHPSQALMVMDIVYTPRITRFLKDARASGCRIVTGETMFLAQAKKSFELWTASIGTGDR